MMFIKDKGSIVISIKNPTILNKYTSNGYLIDVFKYNIDKNITFLSILTLSQI